MKIRHPQGDVAVQFVELVNWSCPKNTAHLLTLLHTQIDDVLYR